MDSIVLHHTKQNKKKIRQIEIPTLKCFQQPVADRYHIYAMAYLHHLGRIVRPLCIWLDEFEIAILLRRNIYVRNAIDLCAAAAAVVVSCYQFAKMHQ